MRTATLALTVAILAAMGPLARAQGLPPQGIMCAHEGLTEEEAHGAAMNSLSVDIDDGPDVRALLVFVRFRDDPIDPYWWPGTGAERDLPFFAESILAPDAASITQSDSSLSRYFYEQSRTSPTATPQLRVYGDIYPRNGQGQPETYVTEHDNSYYHSTSGRGYGYLTQEILDSLVTVPGFDIGDYDANADGVLDHLFLVIRSEEKHISRDPQNGVVGYSGCSLLDASNCGVSVLNGRPAPYLR